jgi:hypothetical protein
MGELCVALQNVSSVRPPKSKRREKFMTKTEIISKEDEGVEDKGVCQLLRLSNISLRPIDVVSVYWHMNQEFSPKVVTRIRTKFELFVLESDSAAYVQDIEKLEEALGR